MASIKKTPAGTFQLRVKSKLLPKPFWATFDTHDAAEQYAQQLDTILPALAAPSTTNLNYGSAEAWITAMALETAVRMREPGLPGGPSSVLAAGGHQRPIVPY